MVLVDFFCNHPEKAQQLISAVESGQIPISEGIKLLENIIKAAS